MKITKKQLKRIIKEEARKLLREGWNYGGWNGEYGGRTKEGSDVLELVGEELAKHGVTADPTFWNLLESYVNQVERASK